MRKIGDNVKKFHIPEVTSIGADAINFSHNGDVSKQIKINGDKLHGLLSIDIKSDIPLNSKEFFHKYNPGERLVGDDMNMLYYSPFHPNLVRKGDLIVMKDENGKIEVAQYLGGKHYMIKPELAKPLITKLAVINSYNFHKSIVRNPDTKYLPGFKEFYYRLLDSKKLQLDTKKGTGEYPYNGTQRLYDTFVDELQTIYQEHGTKAEEIILDLNQRRVIKKLGDGKSLHQNRNSRSFYRDANYSFSIVDDSEKEDTNELAIVSFLPTKDNAIEIVQIGGNSNYPKEKFMEDRTTIIDYMKEYFRKLGFKQLRILRGDKNINFIHPKQSTLREDFNLHHHQETMLLRYNATPNRKRGFSKPDEWYSYYDL